MSLHKGGPCIVNEPWGLEASGLTVFCQEHWSSFMEVALVRAWKRAPQQLLEFFERWNMFQAEFPFQKVVLAIDDDKDKGQTLQSITQLYNEGKVPEWLCPVFVEGCGSLPNWCTLLNTGLAMADAMGLSSSAYVLVSSFEAVPRDGFGATYRNAMQQDSCASIPMIGIRKTLPGFFTPEMEEFIDCVSTRKLREIIADAVEYISNHHQDDGVPYFLTLLKLFGRNTMAIYRRQALRDIGDFDCRCDYNGGMEDLMAMLLIEARKVVRDNSSLGHAAEFLFNYDDSRLVAGQKTQFDETQQEKAEREDHAVAWVLADLKRRLTTSIGASARTPCPQFPQNPYFGSNW